MAKKILLLLVLCIGPWAMCAVGADRIRVTGESVNLRAGPGEHYEVVTQAQRGDILTALAIEGEWIKVAPPQTADLCVYGELVRDGVVVASRVQVRAGPGVNYTPLGRVDKGDRLDVRSEFNNWLKIAPPPGCAVWMSRDYAGNVAPLPTTPPPQPAKVAPLSHSAVIPPRTPVVAARPAVPQPPERIVPHPPAREDATVSEPPGVEFVGVLRRAGLVFRRPSRYRLVRRDRTGRAVTVCYVQGEEGTLRALVGRQVCLGGSEKLIQGVKFPVISVQKVTVVD